MREMREGGRGVFFFEGFVGRGVGGETRDFERLDGVG